MQNSQNKSNNPINLDILKRLRYIYGSIITEEKTLGYAKQINELIYNYKSKSAFEKKSESWSEKTILLITYADNINKGVSGKTLENFTLLYKKYFSNFIDTIHFLPFFTSSSDGGFSVKNHEEIDPVFGSWEDIKKISQNTNIMTDLVLNHASSQGKWFKNFIENKDPGQDYFFTVNESYDCSKVIRPRDHNLLKEVKFKNGSKTLWCTFSYDQIDLNFKKPRCFIRVY